MNGEFCIDKDCSWIRSPCLSFCRHCGLPNVLVPCAPRLPTQSERRPPLAPCKTMHDIASTMWNIITAKIHICFGVHILLTTKCGYCRNSYPRGRGIRSLETQLLTATRKRNVDFTVKLLDGGTVNAYFSYSPPLVHGQLGFWRRQTC